MKAPSTRRSRLAAALGTVAVVVATGGLFAPAASAAEAGMSDVTLTWGFNQESNGGSFFGGCNFLSAGAAGDSGSSRLWTEADGFYKSSEGNVSVLKDGPNSTKVAPTWATKCQDAAGTAVKTLPGSTSGGEVVLSHGTGSTDAAGITTVNWQGSFTVAYYGGLTYWTATDPKLTVDADGTAFLTATGSGWGASMEDPTKWVTLTPTQIHLADFSHVSLTDSGFTATPDYAGVAVNTPEGVTAQNRTNAGWGAFPQSYIDFQVATGQSSYWYSSGGSQDGKKTATPLSVAWTSADAGAPADGQDVSIGVTVPQATPSQPEEFTWSIDGSGSVNLGNATQTDSGAFAASGSLPTITVTDTRSSGTGWSLNGSASAFASATDQFAGSALGWTPAVANNTAGAVAGAAAAAANPGLGTSAVLASAANGHSTGSVDVNASLSLLAPAGTPAGQYASTLTITALSE